MSKHETWRTRMYWEQVGGLLIEEFLDVTRNKLQSRRVIDGLIVLNEKKVRYDGNYYNIKDKDLIVIQTKSGRLGMSLLGQAYFSKLLIEKHAPRSIRSVAICGKSDAVLEAFAYSHNIEIVEIDTTRKP